MIRINGNEFGRFQQWLISQDYEFEQTKSKWEVLRWKTTKPGTPKPIIFKRSNSNFFTLNKEACEYYADYKDGFK